LNNQSWSKTFII